MRSNGVAAASRLLFLAGLIATAVCAGGCGQGFGRGLPEGYVKPTIAVMKFENNAPFPLKWNLGDGMRDILVDRLVDTGCYHVLERGELQAVLAELKLQSSGLTRDHGKATPGRWKNVQYLIKGTITDFGHVSSDSRELGIGGLGVFGGGSRAVMGMTLYVVDVESGEIICSERIEESVRSKDVSVQALYKDVAFRGQVFHQTPLGRATARVIEKAVGRITRRVVAQPWVPKVAKVLPDGRVLLTGGSQRKMRVGAELEIIQRGEAIIDPDSGDVLGRTEGRTIARVRIVDVQPKYAAAEILRGQADDIAIGMRCQPPAEVTASTP